MRRKFTINFLLFHQLIEHTTWIFLCTIRPDNAYIHTVRLLASFINFSRHYPVFSFFFNVRSPANLVKLPVIIMINWFNLENDLGDIGRIRLVWSICVGRCALILVPLYGSFSVLVCVGTSQSIVSSSNSTSLNILTEFFKRLR